MVPMGESKVSDKDYELIKDMKGIELIEEPKPTKKDLIKE